MFQAAAIAMIVAALGGAVYLSQRPTVATSEGLVDLVHDLKGFKDKPLSAFACDGGATIGVDGGEFDCRVEETPYHCRIYRTGSIRCEPRD